MELVVYKLVDAIDWRPRRKRDFMEDATGRGSECQKTMGGKIDATNGSEKDDIPSCCLKARASAPESEAKCHSTVVSGWFSQPPPASGHYSIFTPFLFLCLTFPLFKFDYL